MAAKPPLRPLVAAAALVVLAASASAEPVNLEGTWYVLVHYKDDSSPHPDQERWEDKVWQFEAKGRRLGWTEYPIVVFDDETGRFERRASGQYARILHYWEPNAGQLADIADGLQVNPRGSKHKRLRGSDARGWTSGRPTAAASASVLTYSEVWSISGMPDRPVFSREDYLSGARSDSMEGLTRYTTTEVSNGGNLLVGSFERDGTRHGTFRMMRSGGVGELKSKKTQAELQRQAFRRTIEESPEARAQAQGLVAEQLQAAGVPLSDAEIDDLGKEAVGWFVQGVPDEEIEERLAEHISERVWSFAKRGASHDDSARYRWPFGGSTPRRLILGVQGDVTQRAPGRVVVYLRRPHWLDYAFDFALPAGTPVVAARDGVVGRVVDGYDGTQDAPYRSNAVLIRHADGSFAIYSHLQAGVDVKMGQAVKAGEVLGRSGTSGQVPQPELFFAVGRLDDGGKPHSVDIRFDDGTPEGVVPVAGLAYGGR